MSTSAQKIASPQGNWGSSSTPTAEEMKSKFHYLFLAVDGSGGVLPTGGIEVHENKQYFGISAIDRGRFTLIRNKEYVDQRAAIGGEDEVLDNSGMGEVISFVRGAKRRICYAQEIAVRLEANYWDTYGVVSVSSLIGLPEAVTRWIERVLLPRFDVGFYQLRDHVQQFDMDNLPATPATPEWQGWLMMSQTDMRVLVEAVRADVLRSCNQGASFGERYYSDYVAEMRQAMIPGRGGVSIVSPKLRHLCKEFNFPTPDDLANQVKQAQVAGAAVAATEIKIPGLEQLIQMLVTQGFTINAPKDASAPAADMPLSPEGGWDTASQPSAPEATVADAPAEASAAPAAPSKTIAEKMEEVEPFEPPKRGAGGKSAKK